LKVSSRETLDFLENIIDEEVNHIRELRAFMERHAAQGKVRPEA